MRQMIRIGLCVRVKTVVHGMDRSMDRIRSATTAKRWQYNERGERVTGICTAASGATSRYTEVGYTSRSWQLMRRAKFERIVLVRELEQPRVENNRELHIDRR